MKIGKTKFRMLIGLTGKEGSGKTTIGKLLTGNDIECYIRAVRPKEFVLKELKYCKEEDILFLMRKFVDSEWNWLWCRSYIVEYPKNSEWIELSFADPLKKVCSVLFNYPYEYLLGEKYREERETYKSYEYQICGALTGREILKYFGSQMMRNNFDENIWVNILKSKIIENKKILITDIRHENEKEMLLEMGCQIFLVVRDVNSIPDDNKYVSIYKLDETSSHEYSTGILYNTKDIDYLRKQLIALDILNS